MGVAGRAATAPHKSPSFNFPKIAPPASFLIPAKLKFTFYKRKYLKISGIKHEMLEAI